ncbi:NAC domain-containing protein 48-like [Phragmites australis]|uniref:NAC domain-containing protein 48-like n=1 Tax=Phragmites australis TaxID=29695 RepID=UPI002D76F767|nr:NAC domain-containing protein 48-like [Phragmites australis]
MEDEPHLGAEEEDEEDDDHAADLAGEEFDPTEDELVLHFLRPQLRGFPPRVAGAVVEADPCGAAPWELLARYGLRDQGHFFAARGRKKPFVRRSVGGGAWMHSATRCGQSVSDLGVVVRWCRVNFCFYVRGELGQQRSTGWIMEEYEITDPRCYRRDDEGEEDEYWVLCRVRKSKRTVAQAASPSLRDKVRRRLLAAGCWLGGEDELDPDSGVKAKSRPRRT